MNRTFIVAGAVGAAVAVVLGAFAAHALKNILAPDRLDIFQTGIRYLMLHAVALVLSGSLPETAISSLWRTIAGIGFMVGAVAFSGSLVLLALTGIRIMGAIAPIGGVAFVAGWLSLAMCVIRRPQS